MIAILGLVLMCSFVLAINGNTASSEMQISANAQSTQELKEQIRENIQERREISEEVRENIREKMRNGEELSVAKKGLILRKINGEIMELEAKKVRIKTRLELNNEGNGSEIKTRLSNGRNAEIKIMPDVASEKALTRLRLKVCNESNNCTIELKEVGQGNQTRAVYEARVKKTFRLFGIFKNREEILTQIDAETGEELETRRPWWAWMASESEEAE